MAIQTHRSALDDLNVKRSLLRNYRENWQRELATPTLAPKQRKRIEHDVALLRVIDEDLLRLERLLKQNRAILNIDDNAALRDQIAAFVSAAGSPVTVDCLCERFDMTPHDLRNVCRPLIKAGSIIQSGNAYSSAQPPPSVLASISRAFGRAV